jgi:hypothetical protein
MAQQITNTFLKSKMNKDLDDRILPNGEYRDARNISVGRSEDNDVGALENIIGNNLVASTDLGSGLTIIGMHKSNSTDEIFIFLTNYTDPLPLTPTNAPAGSLHYIYVYNHSNESYTRLVEGEFLNFSTTNRIIGINLIERLLFWTDNRNQPRKINVNLANPTQGGAKQQEYYTQEHQISVAKYNPYQPIELYNRIDVEIESAVNGYFLVPGDQVAKFTPFIGATVVSAENNIGGDQFIKVTSASFVAGKTRVFVSPVFTSPVPTNDSYITLISSTMTNETDNLDWPGDPDYLEDRFVRFSYRFKYDDNEYSLMAPFTQIAYIPKQGGFFIAGDENSAYQSTIVDFMENFVQNIGLVIPLPTNANRLLRDYKISELEILFRESNGVAVKVLESVSAGEINASSGISNRYTYDYQSRKPYKTLPEAQTVRVYDKVPVRAFSQESSGNRIIYGNYRDQHTPPANLNYNCVVSDKFSSGTSNNWVEYPNHSVKRNRNYQIGFVLADKFGRQSPVILSSVDTGVSSGGSFFSGSTIYSSYDANQEDTVVRDWFGDSIKVIVNAQITSNINTSTGTPGLYAIEQQEGTIGTGIGFATLGSPVIVSDSTYTFSLSSTAYPNNDNIPRQNDYLRGAYEDFVKVTNITGPSGGGQVYTVTTSGRVNDVYLRADNLPANTPDIKFAYTINDLGWYSYKIVVKQTEQDYYNVYLPGILNGYPFPQTTDAGFGVTNGAFPTNETNNTAFTTLFNDNINKIPRDLQEVGPDQKQYSSSVLLYGRVTNITEGSLPDGTPYNKQYYPRIFSQGKNAIAHTSTAIANAAEVNMSFRDILGVTPFYQIDTNPLIARISTTEKGIGATYGSNPVQSSDFYMQPYLAVYETEPTESLLEIYWETTTAGLIVDLNTAIASGSGGASSFENVNWDFKESFLPSTSGAPVYVTDEFYPLNEEGDPYLIDIEGELVSVIDGNGDSAEGLFSLQPGVNANTFRLRFDGPSQVFREGSIESNVYTFEINITPDGEPSAILTLGGIEEGEGAMQNVAPAFNFATIVQKNPLDRTLIPAVPNTAATPWLATLPANGTSATNNSKKSQLVYTIARQDGNPLPSNWSMSPSTGKLTQAIPGDVIEGVEFLGNPAVVYPCTITITDANASGANGFYGSLTAQRDVDISLGYPAVNDGVISDTCVLNAYGTNGTDGTPGNAIKSDTQNDKVSHIYYIGGDDFDTNLNTIWDDNGLSNFDRFTNSTRLNNGSVSDAHKTGTVAFTFNVQQGNGTVPRGVSSFKIEKVVFYYRFEGGNGIWQELDRSLDYNATDKKATSGDFPGEDGLVVSNTDNEDTIKWLQNVRAYDYAAFAANSGGAGVEYAVLIKDLELKSGQGGNTGNTVYGWVTADDLHYPICANRQGINVSATSYKYFRSPGSGSYGAATVGLDEVFAETPYGEYVNLFFTSAAMTEPYIPAVGLNNVNFQLDQTGYETLYQWDDLASFSDVILRWVAAFSPETGIKEASPYNSSKATTTYVAASSNPGNGLRILNGTTRVKNNQ